MFEEPIKPSKYASQDDWDKYYDKLNLKARAETAFKLANIKMAVGRTFDILLSFKSDSAGLPNTSAVRTKELADSPTSRFRWFEDGYKLTTVSGRYRNRYWEIYENSFSKQRNPGHEPARINLNRVGLDRNSKEYVEQVKLEQERRKSQQDDGITLN